MPATADSILAFLETVAHERASRALSPPLEQRVRAVKLYQQRRFSHTYADLLTSPRYAGAARFFLDELYGPADFSQRDAQFARVVPALVRLFPRDVVETVSTLAQLHALSEGLDSEVARHLVGDQVDASTYITAWQDAGGADRREMQVALTLAVARSLDQLTRKPLLRHTLRMMRGPAHAAGLAELQRFLEAGFDIFVAMRGADEFLAMIGTRERALMQTLFDAQSRAGLAGHSAALGQLP